MIARGRGSRKMGRWKVEDGIGGINGEGQDLTLGGEYTVECTDYML